MGKRAIALTREYRGVTIFRKTTFGSALPWTARSLAGDPLAADTLAGMKELIRDSEKR